MGAALKDEKLDAIICVAGGSTGGNAQLQLVATTELMWRQNVSTSLIASAVASEYLKEGGILILRGALAALEGTPGEANFKVLPFSFFLTGAFRYDGVWSCQSGRTPAYSLSSW